MTDDNNLDRRVERTRNLLHTALLDLILEKPFDKITVQEIIDRANVGRSTFYAHFTDKHDLLRSGFAHLTLDIQSGLSDAPGGDVLLSVRHIFEHAAENYRPYRALLGDNSVVRMRKSADQTIAKAFLEHLEGAQTAGRIKLPVPPMVLAQFMGGALHALMLWWMEEHMPYTPAEMDALFNKIIAGTVREFAAHTESQVGQDDDTA